MGPEQEAVLSNDTKIAIQHQSLWTLPLPLPSQIRMSGYDFRDACEAGEKDKVQSLIKQVSPCYCYRFHE
jgi:hypothetical protein